MEVDAGIVLSSTSTLVRPSSLLCFDFVGCDTNERQIVCFARKKCWRISQKLMPRGRNLMRNENGGKKSGPILNSTSKQDYEVLSIRQTIANAGRDNKECFQEPRVSWLRTFDKSLYTLQSCLRLSIICIRRSHIKRSVHNSMNPRFRHKSNQDIKCHSKEDGNRQCWKCMFVYRQ